MSLSWERARTLLGVNAPKTDDWPPVLTAEEIAELQYPCVGDTAARRKTRGDQRSSTTAPTSSSRIFAQLAPAFMVGGESSIMMVGEDGVLWGLNDCLFSLGAKI